MFTMMIFGNPVAQGRPRAYRRGKHIGVYDPNNSREWKNKIALIAQKRVKEGQDERYDAGVALEMTVTFFLSRPKSVSVNKRPYPTVRPDLDNLVKAIKDALSGIVYHDDSQIVKLTANKEYDDYPRVEIRVKKLKV